jgi:hypothetical protein
MAEEKKEKDNFLLIVGVIVAISIALVVVLKSRETEHLNTEKGANQDISKKFTHPGNKFTE